MCMKLFNAKENIYSAFCVFGTGYWISRTENVNCIENNEFDHHCKCGPYEKQHLDLIFNGTLKELSDWNFVYDINSIIIVPIPLP